MDEPVANELADYVYACVDEFDKWAKRTGWRQEVIDAYELEAGRQWPEKDKKILEEQRRPIVVFNEFLRFVDAVSGYEINNKMAHRYVPANIPEDSAAVDMVNSVIDQQEDELNPACSTQAFRDLLVAGMGWTELKMDYDTSFEGVIQESRRDPLEMGWDFRATKPDLSDGKYRFRYERLSKAIFKEEWPDKYDEVKVSTADGNLTFNLSNQTVGRTEDRRYHFDNAGDEEADRDTIPVVHFQWREKAKQRVIMSPDGEEMNVDEESYRKLSANLKKMGIPLPSAQRTVMRFYECIIANGVILKDKTEIPFWRFTPMTGKYDRNKRYWFGMARVARDPQMWGNKFFSSIMHTISTSGKGLIMEKGAVSSFNQQQFEEDWSKPHKIKWVEEGAISGKKYAVPDQTQLPPALGDMMNFAFSAIQQTLGISLEFMGMSGRTQAGVVEDSRRAGSIAVLAEFFDSRRSHVQRTGRLKLAFACRYLPDRTFLRVFGPQAQMYLPQIRDVDFMSADVKVDEMALTTNQKGEIWSMIIDIMQRMQGQVFPPKVLLKLLRYSPLPASLIDELEKLTAQPDPVQQQAQQLGFAQKQADIEETRSKTGLNIAKAQDMQHGHANAIISQIADAQDANASMQRENARFATEMRQGQQRFSQKMAQDQAKFVQNMAQARLKFLQGQQNEAINNG